MVGCVELMPRLPSIVKSLRRLILCAVFEKVYSKVYMFSLRLAEAWLTARQSEGSACRHTRFCSPRIELLLAMLGRLSGLAAKVPSKSSAMQQRAANLLYVRSIFDRLTSLR